MIINGDSYSDGGWWSKHLQNAETNEKVTLVEIVGLEATTIPELFHEMEILAQGSGSKADNYFYQANINTLAHERLTPEQRVEAKELLLENLGLTGQPHFVVEHEKKGRLHFHIVTFRIDLARGRAISDSLTAPIHERTSRELEIRFDLERGQSILIADRGSKRPARRPKKAEIFRGTESGIDPATVKADLQAAKRCADDAHSFRAALETSGDYVLARGDRRAFVVIDRAGDDHSLARRLGMKAAELRAFMAGLDPASLPSVDEARSCQNSRAAVTQKKPEKDMAFAASQEPLQAAPPFSAPSPPLTVLTASDGPQNPTAGAIGKPRPPEFEDMDEDTFTKQRQQRQEIEDKEAARYNDMVAEKNRADRFIQEWQISHDQGERNRRFLQDWQRESETDITDVRVRALIAAGESRDFVQAVRREGAMISQEHAVLERKAAIEADPDKKQMLYLKRDIQHADYMALANERIAAMSNLNSEQYKEAQRQQEEWAKIGTDLRKERLELQERMVADQEKNKANTQAAEQTNAADRQREEYRGDIRQSPTADEERETQGARQQAHEAASAPGQEARPVSEAERGATVDIHFGPSRPEPATQPMRENTDARQAESTTAETIEITDVKAAKKAALAQMRAETEQSIAAGHDRGHSR